MMSTTHPYVGLPSRAFWRSVISGENPIDFRELYRPKFDIGPTTRIAAAGSCFAQHIAREFKTRGFTFLDFEPPPALLPQQRWKEFGYDLYSARYGNVYTMRQLLQLVERAYGALRPADDVWEQDGRFYDPYRPAIEPGGFESADELKFFNTVLLDGVRRIVESCDLFVFTFGLTEAWLNADDGIVYPTCPGTIAGSFDPSRHKFHNFICTEVLADTGAFINFVRQRNPDVRFLFTVSPVPLVATASGGHVLPATVYSKSVLRTVCGELEARHDFVDYFPSYEMVASHPARATFFASNMREVTASGVAHVMDTFFASHGVRGSPPVEIAQTSSTEAQADQADDLVCEEVVLDAFGR